jgi:hypothetical protein
METGPFCDLPIEVREKLLSLVQDEHGEVTVPDDKAFFEFVQEFGRTYPVLYQLLKLNEAAVRSHYEATGEVPPGIELTMTSHRIDSNVVDLTVVHGGRPSRG